MLHSASSKILVLIVVLWTIRKYDCGDDSVDTPCEAGNTDDITSGSIVACSPDVDPFSETRNILDDLRYAGEDGVPYSATTQQRRVKEVPPPTDHGGKMIKVKTAAASGVLIATAAKKTKIATVAEKIDTAVTEAIEKAGEVAQKVLKKGLKVLSAIASCAQFVGPILDIIMMFLPTAAKSPELKAIEKGFAETDAALEAMSLKLDQIEDNSDFNALVTDLLEFESSVEHGMEKYKAFAEYLDEIDTTMALPSQGKSMLEDYINYIRSTGKIGQQLEKFTTLILEGSPLVSNGEHLLSIFRRAEKNDCSKILPFAHRILGLIQNAQKLQFLYEMNQGIIEPEDDKGYPRVVYDIYVEVSEQYIDCYHNVATYAPKVSNLKMNSRSLTFILECRQFEI